MRFAFVVTNLLDLWAEPRFNSERSSQLFFCELLTIHDEQQGYLLAKQADGYTGWVDKRQVVEIDESAYKAYSAGPKSVVKTPQSIILDAKRTKTPPHFLFYGTYVRAVRNSNEMVIVALPDGAKHTIKSSAITPVKSRTRDRVTGAMLVAEARRFLGVPYLWGGVSPAGFDCSGLVQTICRRFGLSVPRDTKDQLAAGTEVPRQQIKTGDLLFFKRHVGFAVDRDKIIHASVGGSGVRVNSLQPGLADYREDLDRDFNQARRLL